MGGLKEKYFKMTGPQLTLLAITLLVIEAAGLYYFLISPAVAHSKKLKDDNRQAKQTIRLQEAQIANLTREPQLSGQIGPEQMNNLNMAGNRLFPESAAEELFALLKDLAEKSGGRGVRMEKGAFEDAVITVGPRKDAFNVKKLPVDLRFETNYAGMSSFLFQAKALGVMMKINGFELKARDLKGATTASVKLALYFQESSAAEQEPEPDVQGTNNNPGKEKPGQ